MSVTVNVNSTQWTAIAQEDRDEAKNFDVNSDTYKALIAAANAADTAAQNPTNTALAAAAAQAELTAINALKADSTASATLAAYKVDIATVLDIPHPENTDTNEALLMAKLNQIANSKYSDGTAEGDLVVIMMLLLQFAQIAKTAARTERKAELDSALAALNNAAEKIHAAALDRYNGAIGKAVFEIAGAATTIATSVALVAHTQADAEPVAPTRGVETDEQFNARITAYENEPEYLNAKTRVTDGTDPNALNTYELTHPRPTRLSGETDAEFQTRLDRYKSEPDYQALPNDSTAADTYVRQYGPKNKTEQEYQNELVTYRYHNNNGTYDKLIRRGNVADIERYEAAFPPPTKPLSADEYRAQVDAFRNSSEFKSSVTKQQAALDDYKTTHPYPVQAETDAQWAARQNAHAEEFQKYTQATNMKQTMLMTYSQLTSAVGQLVSAPGGVFEASYNLKAAGEEEEQKKLEAQAQMHNAKADDAQSTKQSMGETINTIISALRDIKKDLNDLAMSITRAV